MCTVCHVHRVPCVMCMCVPFVPLGRRGASIRGSPGCELAMVADLVRVGVGVRARVRVRVRVRVWV